MVPLFQFGLFGSGGIDPTKIGDTRGAYDIYVIILRFLHFAFILAGAIAVIYIIIAGIQYIIAGGADAKQVEAKRTITAAIIGLIIIMSAYLIVGQLLQTLGFNGTIKQEINQNIRQAAPADTNTTGNVIR